MDFLLRARDKNKNDQNNLPRKLVDYCPKEGDHKPMNLETQKQTNAPITSKDVFPKRSAKMINP